MKTGTVPVGFVTRRYQQGGDTMVRTARSFQIFPCRNVASWREWDYQHVRVGFLGATNWYHLPRVMRITTMMTVSVVVGCLLFLFLFSCHRRRQLHHSNTTPIWFDLRLCWPSAEREKTFGPKEEIVYYGIFISAFVSLPPSVGRHLRGSLPARQHTRITGSRDHWEAWYFIELLGQDSAPELHVAVVLLLLNGFFVWSGGRPRGLCGLVRNYLANKF